MSNILVLVLSKLSVNVFERSLSTLNHVSEGAISPTGPDFALVMLFLPSLSRVLQMLLPYIVESDTFVVCDEVIVSEDDDYALEALL